MNDILVQASPLVTSLSQVDKPIDLVNLFIKLYVFVCLCVYVYTHKITFVQSIRINMNSTSA